MPRIDVKENIALAINIALFSKGFRLVIPALSYKKKNLKIYWSNYLPHVVVTPAVGTLT